MREYVWEGGAIAKFAVTVIFLVIVICIEGVIPVASPDQLLNTKPAFVLAVNVTISFVL